MRRTVDSENSARTTLFLMEFILAIMFLAISCAICIQVFTNAKLTTDKSRNISSASFSVQNAAELYRKYGIEYFTEKNLSDMSWHPCENKSIAEGKTNIDISVSDFLIITISETEKDGFSSAEISAEGKDGEEYCKVNVLRKDSESNSESLPKASE